MWLEIIRHTPIWVFVLFVALVWMGFQLSRERNLSLGRALGVPLVMSVLSLLGVASAFHGSVPGLALWGVGLLTAIGVSTLLGFPRGIRIDSLHRRVIMPGSWLPFGLMMVLFFTKYAVGVSLAQHPNLIGMSAFVLTVSLIYGAVSGLFLSRALGVLRGLREQRLALA